MKSVEIDMLAPKICGCGNRWNRVPADAVHGETGLLWNCPVPCGSTHEFPYWALALQDEFSRKKFLSANALREKGYTMGNLLHRFGAIALLLSLASGCASMIGMGERKHEWRIRDGIKKESQEEINTEFAQCAMACSGAKDGWNCNNACLYAKGYVHEIRYERGE